MHLRSFGALFAVLVLTSMGAGAADLPPPVLMALRAVNIPPSSVSAVVQDVGGIDAPSVRTRSDVAVNPASTMKLVTTYAALELLGPAYRWKTEVSIDGEH